MSAARPLSPAGPGYHAGERAVQRLAGTEDVAARMSAVTRTDVPAVAREFLLRQQMVVIGAVGLGGHPWASALTGDAGFLRAEEDGAARGVLHIDALPAEGDPLHGAFARARPVGMIAVDFAARRRMRMNGRAAAVGAALRVELDQVYANCPKYIQRREPLARTGEALSPAVTPELPPGGQDLVRAADTFFIASADPSGAFDASHRGGPPGFVAVRSARRLTWPDYAGNGMFNTLGNIAADPRAGLLFADWATGRALRLTGRATTVWDESRRAGFPGAQRLVDFDIDQVLDAPGVA